MGVPGRFCVHPACSARSLGLPSVPGVPWRSLALPGVSAGPPREPCGASRSPAESCIVLRSSVPPPEALLCLAGPCRAVRSQEKPSGALRSLAEPCGVVEACGAHRSPAEPGTLHHAPGTILCACRNTNSPLTVVASSEERDASQCKRRG